MGPDPDWRAVGGASFKDGPVARLLFYEWLGSPFILHRDGFLMLLVPIMRRVAIEHTLTVSVRKKRHSAASR